MSLLVRGTLGLVLLAVQGGPAAVEELADLQAWLRRYERNGPAASVEDVRARAQPLLAFSAEVEAEHLELKRYLRQHLYRHYKVLRMTTKARRVVRELFEAMKEIAETGNGPREQTASMGCSIKWKAA